MIEFRLNKKKTKIPVFDEFTCQQIYDWNNLYRTGKIRITSEPFDVLRNYLSIVLNRNMFTIDSYVINDADVNRLILALGSPKDVSKLKRGVLYVKDEKIDTNKINLNTLGQRFMIEQNAAKLKDEDLMCFELATAIEGGQDITKIQDTHKELMSMNYITVMPHAFFLHKNLVRGKQKGIVYLWILTKLVGMIRKRKEPGLIG